MKYLIVLSTYIAVIHNFNMNCANGLAEHEKSRNAYTVFDEEKQISIRREHFDSIMTHITHYDVAALVNSDTDWHEKTIIGITRLTNSFHILGLHYKKHTFNISSKPHPTQIIKKHYHHKHLVDKS